MKHDFNTELVTCDSFQNQDKYLSDWLSFDLQFVEGHNTWLIAWTINNLAVGWSIRFQKFWSAVLKFEQFHSPTWLLSKDPGLF